MPRRSRSPARALAAAAALALACAPPRSPSQAPIDAIPHATPGATVGVKPAIVAAQLREPTLADLEEGRTIAHVIYLVLSVPVDPVTVAPEHFVVALDDGRRVRPARVLLSAAGVERQTLTLALAGPPPPQAIAEAEGAREIAPAGETPAEGTQDRPERPERRPRGGDREKRTDRRSERPSPSASSSSLPSSSSSPPSSPPSPASAPAPATPAPASPLARPLALTITGNLFSASGEPLGGLAAEVDAIDRPPRAVLARRLAQETGDHGCEGDAQVIRTTWTAPLAGDEAPDLAAIAVVAGDGGRAHPSAVVGLQVPAGALQRGDNVVDLCVAAGVGLARLVIDAGALRDVYGLPSAAVDLPITRGARG